MTNKKLKNSKLHDSNEYALNSKLRRLFWNSSGYTLVELTIVVMIMAILFTVGYGNYRSYQRRQYLETAVRQVVSDLRLSQEYALSGRKPVDPLGNACETSTLSGYRFII